MEPSLPPSIESLATTWGYTDVCDREFIQRIAAEAARLQREADYLYEFGPHGLEYAIADNNAAARLVVEPPK